MVIEGITKKYPLQKEFESRKTLNKNPKEYSYSTLFLIIILTMAAFCLCSFSLME